MSVAIKQFPAMPVSEYAAIRPHIRSGDILMCSGQGWFSKMIQRATGSIWSHVAFVIRLDAIDRIMVLESVEPVGVRTVPLSKYLFDYDAKGNPYAGGLVLVRHADFEARAKPEKLKRLGQFAVDLFGYPYDRQEIAKIAARIAASAVKLSAKETRELKRDREYICSEYVWECYHEMGIRIPHNHKGFIAPSDFAQVPAITAQYVLQKLKGN